MSAWHADWRHAKCRGSSGSRLCEEIVPPPDFARRDFCNKLASPQCSMTIMLHFAENRLPDMFRFHTRSFGKSFQKCLVCLFLHVPSCSCLSHCWVQRSADKGSFSSALWRAQSTCRPFPPEQRAQISLRPCRQPAQQYVVQRKRCSKIMQFQLDGNQRANFKVATMT